MLWANSRASVLLKVPHIHHEQQPDNPPGKNGFKASSPFPRTDQFDKTKAQEVEVKVLVLLQQIRCQLFGQFNGLQGVPLRREMENG